MIDWLPYVKPSSKVYDKDFLWLAYDQAQKKSTDPSTQNGSVLVRENKDGSSGVIALGANFFPYGVKETPERWDRAVKLNYVEHAERKPIYECAKRGIATNGLTLYCCWYACADCARAIIESGIKRVVGHKQVFDKTPDRWKETIKRAFEMFEEAGIVCEVYDGTIGDGIAVRFDGQIWNP